MKATKGTSQTRWSIDQAHSEISFKVKHLMISNVKGLFTGFDGSIFTQAKDFATAEVYIWIDASTINTRDAKRDEHLKSADFLDVAKHKQITFTSSTMSMPDADGNIELWGELTMVGITKNIKLNVQFGGSARDPWGNERVGFTISGKINRTDWQLTWNTLLETGDLLVGEEINISCEMELIKVREEDLVLRSNSTVRKKILL
ncbi:MAG: polyisoprenoid-binding protein [Cyclobacteriaceae bacterium]|nr:polyisoprenoid-binding protein [Cyclobacteriaceae bacterium]